MKKPYDQNYHTTQRREHFKNRCKKTMNYLILLIVIIMIINAIPVPHSTVPTHGAKSEIARQHKQVTQPSRNYHIESSRIYGSRNNPKGRVVALVKNKEDLNYLKATWNTQTDMAKDLNNGIETTVNFSNRLGEKQASITAQSFPAADIDGDHDVDSDDLYAYRKNPIDFDLDGKTDATDLHQFKSWLGWKKSDH